MQPRCVCVVFFSSCGTPVNWPTLGWEEPITELKSLQQHVAELSDLKESLSHPSEGKSYSRICILHTYLVSILLATLTPHEATQYPSMLTYVDCWCMSCPSSFNVDSPNSMTPLSFVMKLLPSRTTNFGGSAFIKKSQETKIGHSSVRDNKEVCNVLTYCFICRCQDR